MISSERGEHEQKMELARQGHAAAVAAGAEAARVALAAKEKEMKEDGARAVNELADVLHEQVQLAHLTHHTSQLTPHTSHLTPHTSHLTPHTSHLTPHT